MKLNLEEITDAWIADHDLPIEMIQHLKEGHREICSEPCGSPQIAPVHVCSELDLPQGSTWIEVAAALLDACLNPMKQTHLDEVRKHYLTNA